MLTLFLLPSVLKTHFNGRRIKLETNEFAVLEEKLFSFYPSPTFFFPIYREELSHPHFLFQTNSALLSLVPTFQHPCFFSCNLHSLDFKVFLKFVLICPDIFSLSPFSSGNIHDNLSQKSFTSKTVMM
jgi:hypothetical protein